MLFIFFYQVFLQEQYCSNNNNIVWTKNVVIYDLSYDIDAYKYTWMNIFIFLCVPLRISETLLCAIGSSYFLLIWACIRKRKIDIFPYNKITLNVKQLLARMDAKMSLGFLKVPIQTRIILAKFLGRTQNAILVKDLQIWISNI